MVPYRKLIPEQVVVGNEEGEQHDAKCRRRHDATPRDPPGHESAAKRRKCSEEEPGEFHPERKIKSSLRVVIMWPSRSEGQVNDGGDEDPGDQTCDDGADCFDD